VQGNIPGAVRELEKVLETHPDDFQAWYRLGVVQIETDPDKARAALEKAGALFPDHPGPQVFLGFLDVADRNFAASDEALARGYDLCRARLGYSLPDTSDVVGLAIARVELGQPLDALAMLEAEATKANDNAVLWLLAADAALRGGRAESALDHAQHALTLKPGLAAAHAVLGGAYFSLHRYDEARAEAERALELHPGLALALHVQSRVDMAESEYTDGFVLGWSAVLEDPMRPDFYHEMGTEMVQLGIADQGTPVLQYMDWVTAFLGRHLGRPGRSPEEK